MLALRDCRLAVDRLTKEIQSARESDNVQRVEELEHELQQTQRRLRESQAFLDLAMTPPEARVMVSHYYGMVAADLNNRAQVAELNAYLPNQQESRSQQAMEYLFQIWEQLKAMNIDVLPVGNLAASTDPASLRAGAELFGRLAIAASRG